MRALALSLLLAQIVACSSKAATTDHAAVEAVRGFVRESLSSRAFELVLADNATCSAEAAREGADVMRVTSFIDMCASPDYNLRELSPAQVSWKREEGAAAEAEDASTDTSSHVIHDYLVFALVMRNSPYSLDIISMLHSAAVMFPGVSIVFGDGLQFQNFCAQYGIHSLPSVQLFKKGMLYRRYRGRRTPADFAAFLARYTGEPIRAIPQAFQVSNTAKKPHWVEQWGHNPKTWFDRALFVSKLFVLTPVTRWSVWSQYPESVTTASEFLFELLHSDPWLLAALVFVVLRIVYARYKEPDAQGS